MLRSSKWKKKKPKNSPTVASQTKTFGQAFPSNISNKISIPVFITINRNSYAEYRGGETVHRC